MHIDAEDAGQKLVEELLRRDTTSLFASTVDDGSEERSRTAGGVQDMGRPAVRPIPSFDKLANNQSSKPVWCVVFTEHMPRNGIDELFVKWLEHVFTDCC